MQKLKHRGLLPRDMADSELTPRHAYKLYYEKDMSQTEIAEKYEVTQPTVSNYISDVKKTLEKGKEKGVQNVQSNPGDYDLAEKTEDPESENPYKTVSVPCCNSEIQTPNSAGKHNCPSCGKTLEWEKSEI